ncbi:hypothetical protein NERG_02583, partial [Nematocida ausubeli]
VYTPITVYTWAHTCLLYTLLYTPILSSGPFVRLFTLPNTCFVSPDFPWHTLYTARVLLVCPLSALPAFSVSGLSDTFIFLCFPYTQRTLEYFIIFNIPVYTAVYSYRVCIHTCLSYKLALTLSYTLLSVTLLVLFILLLLCAHL